MRGQLRKEKKVFLERVGSTKKGATWDRAGLGTKQALRIHTWLWFYDSMIWRRVDLWLGYALLTSKQKQGQPSSELFFLSFQASPSLLSIATSNFLLINHILNAWSPYILMLIIKLCLLVKMLTLCILHWKLVWIDEDVFLCAYLGTKPIEQSGTYFRINMRRIVLSVLKVAVLTVNVLGGVKMDWDLPAFWKLLQR